MIYDVVIIGAGASGLMAASRMRNKSVAVVDGFDRIGTKIIVSGGGKCNVTNEIVTPKQYDGDSGFFRAVYERFTNRNLLAWMEERGVVPTKQTRVVKNQYFCKSSQEMIDLFRKATRHATFFMNEKVISVQKGDLFTMQTAKQKLQARKVIVAAGGISYDQIGATDIGFQIAKQFGHEIVRPDPALVGFTVLPEQRWFTELSGLSTEVILSVDDRTIRGNILCAHKGITGPAIMVSSLWWRKGKISLDFVPDISLEKLLKGQGNKSLSTILPLPKRFAKGILDALKLEDKPLDRYSSEEKQRVAQIKAYQFAPAGTFGFKRAEVTRGGVATDKIDPSTMESQLCRGLYFTGEVLNITGELGGYNLQWAFSSGWVCGEMITKLP